MMGKMRLIWLAPLACAALELFAHASIRNGVPADADYRAAAERLRAQLRPTDAVSVAPPWIDPIVRQYLGDQMPLAMVGRPDLAAYERLWTISIRGHRAVDAPDQTANLERHFGGVTLRRYALPRPTERYNLVELLQSAAVTVDKDGRSRRCRPYRGLPGPGGALGRGTIPPSERFQCGRDRDAMVAAVVVEDLALQPRYCVWHPALANQPITVRFPQVELSHTLIIDAGLYYEHERDEAHPPVTLQVHINDQAQAPLVHHDGQGFLRHRIHTKPQTASLSFTATSQRTHNPGFCWSASIRDTP